MITLGVPRTHKHSRTALPPANDQVTLRAAVCCFIVLHVAVLYRRCIFYKLKVRLALLWKKIPTRFAEQSLYSGDPDARLRCPPGTPVCGLTPLVSEPRVPQLQNLGIGKTTEDLNDSTNHGDLTHIQRTCHPTAEYECFPSAHGTSSRIGYAHINP